MAGAGELLYLSRADVEAVGLPMSAVIEAMEVMFAEKAAGRVEMPPKPGVHPRPDAFIHAMPAWLPALGAAGVKWVSGFPANVERGLPYIHGLLILNDPETGAPLAVMDATWITAMRTGAVTAVAARRLARADSTTAGIVACGVQGRSNLEALACVLPLKRVRAYDADPETARRYAAEMSVRLGLEIEPVATSAEAVRGADVVVTSGPILKQPEPAIGTGWLAEGGFAAALDFDSYWQPAALAEMDLLVTDDIGQFRYYRESGYFQKTPEPQAELADLVAGTRPGRANATQRTFAMPLGLALSDMATAVRLYRAAREQGIGRALPL